jgi:peptidoglycan/xylan/chitin deacetylase (PgdA/CDA1 family)
VNKRIADKIPYSFMEWRCLTISMVLIAISVAALTGCVSTASRKTADLSVPVKQGRFLLHDQYMVYLSRKDITLKDSFIFSVRAQENIVAITFDDGPSKNTDRILATLKNLDCPAVFFLIGDNILPETAVQYGDPLFEKCIHGYEHENVSIYDNQECLIEVGKARIVFELFGMKSQYFRPPYGAITDGLKIALNDNKLTGVLWSLDSLDWTGLANQGLVDRVVDNVYPGDIILFHETPWTADELELIVKGIREKGFRIVPLSELLHYPKTPSPK